jgi:signal peptide peptidase SppA
MSDHLPAISWAALAPRFFARPLAMEQGHLDGLILGVMAQNRDEGAVVPEANRFVGSFDSKSAFNLTKNGTAILPIHGTLIDRGAWLGAWGGLTSYEGLNEQFKRLAADDDVKRVVLDINSGGGMVAGIWDLFPALDALKDKKPVAAIAQNFAASAAYAIACAADGVVVTRAGHVGSVGVIAQHWNVGKLLKKMGVEPTLITAGAKKGDGNAFGPLPEHVRADWNSHVKKSRKQFVEHVAKYREMSTEDVRATEAGMFEGQDAADSGFADQVMGFDEFLLEFEGESKMSGKATEPKKQAGGGDPAPQMLDEATIRADERTATLTRVSAIMDHDEAKGREDLARNFAFNTDMGVDQVVGLLKTSPKSEPAGQEDNASGVESPLAQQMKLEKNAANVGPDVVKPGDENASDDGDDGDEMNANQNVVSMADRMKDRFASKGGK